MKQLRLLHRFHQAGGDAGPVGLRDHERSAAIKVRIGVLPRIAWLRIASARSKPLPSGNWASTITRAKGACCAAGRCQRGHRLLRRCRRHGHPSAARPGFSTRISRFVRWPSTTRTRLPAATLQRPAELPAPLRQNAHGGGEVECAAPAHFAFHPQFARSSCLPAAWKWRVPGRCRRTRGSSRYRPVRRRRRSGLACRRECRSPCR